MANSATIVLRDLTTGAGRTGLTVKLRRQDDNFGSDYKTASEISGKPGVYEFLDVPFNKYKLWVNGNEESSFGGTNGRWWPVDDMDDVFLSKDSEGHWNHQNGRIYNAADPVSGLDVGDRDYNDARYLLKTESSGFWYVTGNFLIVDDSISVNDSRHFKTIQAAINEAQSHSPNASNQWTIFIMPKKDTVGYNENITLQPNVHLAGLGRRVRIYGAMGGMNVSTKLVNLCWLSLGNFSITNIKAENCTFITDDPEATGFDITLTGTKTKNCELYAYQNVLSGGNNIYINLITCSGFDPQSTDKGSHFSFNQTGGFFLEF